MKVMKKRTIAAVAAMTAMCMTFAAMPVTHAQRADKTSVTAQARSGMVITEAGEYTLKGRLNGTVRIDAEDGKVTLILDNAFINGGMDAAVVQESGDLEIKTVNGTVNSLMSFGGTAVKSGGSITVNGSFSVSSGSAAFDSEKLILKSGTVTAAAQKAAAADTEIVENGGKIVLTSALGKGNAPTENNNASADRAPVFAQGGAQQPRMTQGFADKKGVTAPGADIPSDGRRMQGTAPDSANNTAPFGAQNIQSTTDSPTEVVTGTVSNSAVSLQPDYDNAVTYTLTDNDGEVTISSSGTYVVTGSSSIGGITVKKGTEGVVLILEDLDLTSSTGAALSVNKNAEVQIVVKGTVNLTDAEDPTDETSSDTAVADAFDGAAIKVKANSVVFITGNGKLNINGNAKNGIKGGDESSIIIGGDVSLDITAANDGINGNYDVSILSGTVNISAGDDAVHADRVLTIGNNGKGPDLTVTKSEEGLEGTVVNINGGSIKVTSSDDGINAANSDDAYPDIAYSVNITGGNVSVTSGGDGIDSNGNINLTGGSTSISSASRGGEAGIDYDGSLYISDSFKLNNSSGVAGPDNMGGMRGGMNGGPMGNGTDGGFRVGSMGNPMGSMMRI